MMYTVTLTPALDKTARVDSLTPDRVNRVTECRVDPGGKGINVSNAIANRGGESTARVLLGGNVMSDGTAAADRATIHLRIDQVSFETL